MLIIDEIIKHLGGVRQLQKRGPLWIGRDSRQVVVEHIGFGPTSPDAVRLARYGHGDGPAEPEMHFERRDTVWLPYYYNDGRTGAELFLYGFRSERAPLYLNWEAGTKLIEMTYYLELNLWAEGFREAARELFQPSLFGAVGGAA